MPASSLKSLMSSSPSGMGEPIPSAARKRTMDAWLVAWSTWVFVPPASASESESGGGGVLALEALWETVGLEGAMVDGVW